MANRTVLITGGAAGIGAVVTQAFLDAQDRIVVVDRNPVAAAALSRAYGDRAHIQR